MYMKSLGLRGALVLAVAVAMLSAGAVAQDKEAPDEMTGIDIGQKAPAFKLNNWGGNEYALADLLKEGQVALMFFRSSVW